MREFINDRLSWPMVMRMAFVVFVLAITGPFGTYSELDFAPRLAYWGIVIPGVGLPMIFAVYMMAEDTGDLAAQVPLVLVGCALGAIPGAALVFGVEAVLRPPGIPAEMTRLMRLCAEVWTMGILIAVGTELTQPRGAAPPPDNEPRINPEPVPLTFQVTRLHGRLRDQGIQAGEVISLSMQDHYVELFTDSGRHLVLLRLTDAIAELDGIPGLRIHRSHWVATKHMRDLRRRGQRWFLSLSDGSELPVSQTYLDDVQQTLSEAA